jgi:ABC-type sugar transport system permease subunit
MNDAVQAGLQQIPESLYEAASIDGANGWQFRFITVPGLRGVLVLIFPTITIAAFQLFDQVLAMTNGGPDDATRRPSSHVPQRLSSRTSAMPPLSRCGLRDKT